MIRVVVVTVGKVVVIVGVVVAPLLLILSLLLARVLPGAQIRAAVIHIRELLRYHITVSQIHIRMVTAVGNISK